MLGNPVQISSKANIFEAVKLITDNKISGLCVVDDDNILIGILSELDCLSAILSATYNEGAVGIVREYMTGGNLEVANVNDNIVELAQQMLRQNHRRLPVVEDGKLVGQVTCRQILIAVKNFKSRA